MYRLLSLACLFAKCLLREELEWANFMSNPSLLLPLWITVVIHSLEGNILRRHVWVLLCLVCLSSLILKPIHNRYSVLVGFQYLQEACDLAHLVLYPAVLALNAC